MLVEQYLGHSSRAFLNDPRKGFEPPSLLTKRIPEENLNLQFKCCQINTCNPGIATRQQAALNKNQKNLSIMTELRTRCLYCVCVFLPVRQPLFGHKVGVGGWGAGSVIVFFLADVGDHLFGPAQLFLVIWGGGGWDLLPLHIMAKGNPPRRCPHDAPVLHLPRAHRAPRRALPCWGGGVAVFWDEVLGSKPLSQSMYLPRYFTRSENLDPPEVVLY